MIERDILAALDRSRIGARQWTAVSLALCILVIDGLDFQILALVSPLLMAEWQVDKISLGPAMAAALVGLSVGASVGGSLGDRFGRKPVLIAACLLFGSTTFATASAGGLGMLFALRLASGLGFGAATPNAVALATEWLPQRARARIIGIASVGMPMGGLIGASLALVLLGEVGWRGCFLLCGGATLALTALSMALLPESAFYLARTNRTARALAAVRRTVGVDLGPERPDAPERSAGAPATSIFVPAYRRFNAGMWLCYAGITFTAYAFTAWSAVYLTGAGFALSRALGATFAFNILSISCAVLASLTMRRVGTRLLLTLSAGVMLVSVAGLATLVALDPSFGGGIRYALVLAATGGAGASVGAGTACVFALLAQGYDAGCRASGVGWGVMMGRIGGLASSLGGGYLLSREIASTNLFFVALGLAACAVGAGMALVDRHIRAPGTN